MVTLLTVFTLIISYELVLNSKNAFIAVTWKNPLPKRERIENRHNLSRSPLDYLSG